MLQQTTVAAVKSYYVSFLREWPSVRDLAGAPVDAVMTRWAGLGYYSRARNLHACARVVVAEHGGRFPSTEAELRTLPGVGAYTAAAVAAIAFDRRAVVIDGNVERVIARLYAIETPLPSARPAIRQFADAQTPDARPGDYAQAMMDLGATICTPRRPACVLCPLAETCAARIGGRQDVLPLKRAKPERPVRRGSVFYVTREPDEVLLRTRPPKGLFGGMAEFPGSGWNGDGDPEGAARPLPATYRRLAVPVTHGLSHFELVLTGFAAVVAPGTAAPEGCRWVPIEALAHEALPSLMRKVAAAAREDRNDER